MSNKSQLVTSNDPSHTYLELTNSPKRKKSKRNASLNMQRGGASRPISQLSIPRFPEAHAQHMPAVPSYEDSGVDTAADYFLDPPQVVCQDSDIQLDSNWLEYFQGLAIHKLYWEIDLDNTDKGQACFALANYALSPDGRYQGLKVGAHIQFLFSLS